MAGLLNAALPAIQRGLLAAGPALQAASAQAAASRAAQQQPAQTGLLAQPQQRGRASGWRILDRFLFSDDSLGEALDNERARQQRIADEPRNRALQQAVTAGMNPVEQALFLGMGSEDWRKNVGQQFAPQVIAADGVQSVIGAGRQVQNIRPREFGDSIVVATPQGVQTLATRDPTYAERTAQQNANTDQFKALNPVLAENATWVNEEGGIRGRGYIAPRTLSPGEQLVDPTTREVIARGDKKVYAVGDGAQLYYEDGTLLADNPKDAPSIPDAVRRDNEKDEAAIDERQLVIDRVKNAVAAIDRNLINLDPVSRGVAWVRNTTGNSNDASRAQAELRRTVETLRNQILNDAAGPQTDGDSLRALNQIIDGWGDERVVRDGLNEYLRIQEGKQESQRRIMAQRLQQYGGSVGNAGRSPATIPPPPPGFQIVR